MSLIKGKHKAISITAGQFIPEGVKDIDGTSWNKPGALKVTDNSGCLIGHVLSDESGRVIH